MDAVLGGVDDVLLDALSALAGLHDLPKASWTFQGLGRGPTPLPGLAYAHHSDEGCALLYQGRYKRLPAFGEALRPIIDIQAQHGPALLRAVFSHHGKPRNGETGSDAVLARFRPRPGTPHDPMDLVRELVAAVQAQYGPFASLGTALPGSHAALHVMMGLVNLADWIGSSAAWFPLRPDRPDVFDRRSAALRALDELGLTAAGLVYPSDEDAVRQTLARYTRGRSRELRPAQARAVEAVIAAPPRPGDVLVLEDETGGGKTLVAYLLHAVLARRGLVSGLTFCLPTRASAKAIHDGTVQVYGWRMPTLLALPGYDEVLASPLPDRPAGGGQDPKQALPWAARSRHRFLVAPVAVGTVDQVLLGTLPVPYAHLRSVAASRNLLVVDEVHASDPYMRHLLSEAVARHRRQGGIALLMSATLGADLRARLLEPPPTSRRRGRISMHAIPAAYPALATQDAATVPYPVLWRGPGDPARLSDAGGSGDGSGKEVRIEPTEEWRIEATDAVARRAVEAARAGARVLVVRNTVRLARATAAAVAALDPGLLLRLGEHPVCHHARYAAPDRRALDDGLRTALHPQHRPRAGVIAVTTQTAEQSLDIDADLLITDLVPIDVLLQRIGRLHRNRAPEAWAARPESYAAALCVVLTPADPVAFLDFAPPRGPHPNNWGTDRAYADTLCLAATRELIGAGAQWSLPADNRRLVEGATSDAVLASLEKRHGTTGETAASYTSARNYLQKELAKNAVWTFDEDPGVDTLCRRFDDGAGATRLGLDDVRLNLADPFRSPFGDWTVAAVTVPGHIARDLILTGDQVARWNETEAGVLRITIEGHKAEFTYGPFGLDVAIKGQRA